MMFFIEWVENLIFGVILYVGFCLRFIDCRFKEDFCVFFFFIGVLVDIFWLNFLVLLILSVGFLDFDFWDCRFGVMFFLWFLRDIFNIGLDIFMFGLIEFRCLLELFGGVVKFFLCLDILFILWLLILSSYMNDE